MRETEEYSMNINLKTKMKSLFGIAPCLVLVLTAGFSTSSRAAEDGGSGAVQKPNILWIVTEDIGCDMAPREFTHPT